MQIQRINELYDNQFNEIQFLTFVKFKAKENAAWIKESELDGPIDFLDTSISKKIIGENC